MKKSPFPVYIKTKVIIEFGNGEQAKAFFGLFTDSKDDTGNGLSLLVNSLPKSIDVKKIEKTKELKHNYLVKII